MHRFEFHVKVMKENQNKKCILSIEFSEMKSRAVSSFIKVIKEEMQEMDFFYNELYILYIVCTYNFQQFRFHWI